jgi:hypothetical protein
MPEIRGCHYLSRWVEVKEKWELEMDRQERRFIEAADCRYAASGRAAG